MVHGAGTEGAGALMAGLTSSRRGNVGTRFTFSGAAIMAVCAASGDAGVIHRRTTEGRSTLMTSLASR